MVLILAASFGAAQAQTSGATAARVVELEDQIRRLNGRIEELEFRLRRIADDATRRFGDLEFRLTELEGGDVALLGDPVPLGQTGGAGSGPSGSSTVLQAGLWRLLGGGAGSETLGTPAPRATGELEDEAVDLETSVPTGSA